MKTHTYIIVERNTGKNIQDFLLQCKGCSKTKTDYARSLHHSMQSLGMQSKIACRQLQHKKQIQSMGSQRCKHYDRQDWERLRSALQFAIDAIGCLGFCSSMWSQDHQRCLNPRS